MIKDLTSIKQLDGNNPDPILGVKKAGYDASFDEYLEYLATSDSNIIVMDPNLYMQLVSIAGAKKAYKAEDELELESAVKSRGARI